MTGPACPVCRAPASRPFACLEDRRYWRCETCAATVLDRAHHPSPAAELAHYRHHRNDPADPGYRRFLGRLADPLLARLAPGSAILDYGSGPGPALATMLGESGHRVSLFDPFFAPDPAPLERRYDAVTCTETAEHFHFPAREFDRLAALVRPGGWLALMTCWQTDDARFADWHYRRDPTHVVFYKASTLEHLAQSRGWSIELPAKDVALMRLPA
jgi:SAM-dependent methyltransferase